MNCHRPIINSVASDLRHGWKQLALTDILYKIAAFILLTPLVGILFRALLALSGGTLLADQDILFFFLRPMGWLCCIAVGGLWLAILALEQAALMAVLLGLRNHQRVDLIGAVQFALLHAWPVFRVTARIVGFSLLVAAPFLAVAGIAYAALLTEFDINYYLQNRPPAFLVALGIGGAVVAGLASVLLRLYTSWFFALPLVIFEDVEPSVALKTSGERARGHRRQILAWIVAWAVASFALSASSSSLVVWLAGFLVPGATSSLTLLATAIGVTLAVWGTVNLAVSLLSTTVFATFLFQWYNQVAREPGSDMSQVPLLEGGEQAGRFRLTGTRLIAAGTIGAVAAATVGALVMQGVRVEDTVEIIAHRGASEAAPENTLAAIRQAIEDRADWVEIDVQETKDDEVVVFHDSDFMKLAGKNLKIWDATTADLKAIDIGSWFAPEFKDQRVPTLDEVLAECKGKVGVTIELKYYGHDEDLEQRVIDIVESHGMASEVAVMSLKVEAVRKMKTKRPDWRVGLLMSVSMGDLKNVGADFLAVNAAFVDRRFVAAAHKRGQDVYAWTVNDGAGMSTMIGRGVDGLITDKPALARRVLAERAEMSPLKRLLLELAGILGAPPELGEQ
jgi:glycerophosphoryl diester phosphodiesterase